MIGNGDLELPTGRPYVGDGPVREVSDAFVLLTYDRPVSMRIRGSEWFVLDQAVDGMRIGTLRAFARELTVPSGVVQEFSERVDWAEGPTSVWRRDLSWHATAVNEPNDPVVSRYVEVLADMGLTWTPSLSMANRRYGWRLAQAAYPLDLGSENLRRLGVLSDPADLIGEAVDPRRHALVFVSDNDD